MISTKIPFILSLVAAAAYFAAYSFSSQSDLAISFGDVDFKQFHSVQDFQQRVHLFTEWTRQYEKGYALAEIPHRFTIWNSNYDYVQKHNAMNLSWEVETNQFADLTTEEFAALYLGTEEQSESDIADMAESGEDNMIESEEDALLEEELAAGLDWRSKGAVTSVKNQGQCGGCYAFSATGALEGLEKKKTGKLADLSIAQIIDCSDKNNGCNGGLMTRSFKYVSENGIEKESDYKFTGKEGTCKYNKKKATFKNKGYKMVPANKADELLKAVNLGPVSSSVHSGNDAWKLYKSGVITEQSDCKTKIDHGVLIVGYGTEKKQDYWIVKNSWGTKWGEKGYIRILRGNQNGGKGVCAINRQNSYPN